MIEILALEFCTPIEIYRRMEARISGEHANETSAGKYENFRIVITQVDIASKKLRNTTPVPCSAQESIGLFLTYSIFTRARPPPPKNGVLLTYLD